MVCQRFKENKNNNLGNLLSKDNIKLNQHKIDCTINFCQLHNQKHIMPILGLSGYYRPFLSHKKFKRLARLLHKDEKFTFNSEFIKSLVKFIKTLTSKPSLIWTRDVIGAALSHGMIGQYLPSLLYEHCVSRAYIPNYWTRVFDNCLGCQTLHCNYCWSKI